MACPLCYYKSARNHFIIQEAAMTDIIEKTLLAGIGALALSQKKAEELISELQRRFNLGEEKGQQLLDSLQQSIRDQQQKLEEVARQEVQRTCTRLGVITRDEFDALQKRVLLLEKRLKAADK
jgi:polyhydroxyalkanoate synthesis regulator phasin